MKSKNKVQIICKASLREKEVGFEGGGEGGGRDGVGYKGEGRGNGGVW